MADPDGRRIGHAELRLGPITVMLADEYPELGILSPAAFGGTGMTLHLHVDDVDALAERALRAGATMVREPADYNHGERQCRVRDPFGHEWLLGHEIGKAAMGDVPPRPPKADAPNVFPGLRYRDEHAAMDWLALPHGCEKLSGLEQYRVRQGDYRVVYSVDDEASTVLVVKVGHRRDVYR